MSLGAMDKGKDDVDYVDETGENLVNTVGTLIM